MRSHQGPGRREQASREQHPEDVGERPQRGRLASLLLAHSTWCTYRLDGDNTTQKNLRRGAQFMGGLE